VRRPDLIAELSNLVVDLSGLVARPCVGELTALCETARLAFGAAAVSVAVREGDVLRYRSAAGAGAQQTVGTELPVQRGIAGFVVLSRQALAVDRPADDPRFAQDVAERTGYIPGSLLVVPVDGESGDAVGALSILDRSATAADALELASAFARQAGPIVDAMNAAAGAGRVILMSIVDAARQAEPSVGDALARATKRLPEADAEIAQVARFLAAMRRLDESTRSRVTSLIGEMIELAAPRRHR
jgi:hypothetical protein